jgi:hypothetical protein
MSIEHDGLQKDVQELRKVYALKDPRTPSGSLTAHGLRLERVLEEYRKDIQELNRLFALEDPRPLPDIALFLERMTREQRDIWELNRLYLLEDPPPVIACATADERIRFVKDCRTAA